MFTGLFKNEYVFRKRELLIFNAAYLFSKEILAGEALRVPVLKLQFLN